MDDSRRRQFHSCDPCRKGKRRCDAPNNRTDTGFGACSNCKRWNKECTFTWLSSKPAKRTDPKGGRARLRASASAASTTPASSAPAAISPLNRVVPSIVGSYSSLDDPQRSSQWYPANHPGAMFAATDPSNFVAASALHPEGAMIGDGIDPIDGPSGIFPWNMSIPDWEVNDVAQESEHSSSGLESQAAFPESLSDSLDNTFDVMQLRSGSHASSSSSSSSPPFDFTAQRSSIPGFSRGSKPRPPWGFCVASDTTANDYARSTMTRNLIRIYHDSMENALSCWLTEHNCPYTDQINTLLPFKERKEWGPSWSNRMCIRVCRLDRAAASIRGRALSPEEDKTAARALHLAIIAFASQWTQHAQKGPGCTVPAPIDYDERAIRRNVWNEARHALEHSTTIPSFRIIFANIIFSLTQSPLDNHGQDERLGQLLENDGAPIFLEAANRQLFTFRHKFARLQREAPPPSATELRRSSIGSTMTDVLEMPRSSSPDSPQTDPILASSDHRSTLGLLFWLGIMFDTLSSAMYQRPLVVSDEDSQIASASPSLLESNDQVDLDCWNLSQPGPRKKQDVWGDFFLRSPLERQETSQIQTRWPCSYEEAAAVLSEATPVKVLLYRRVTQLQTLIYRGASRDRLEEVIQKTLLVYQHWNCTYQSFMLDCVANHEILPPRIQSWYVILDGHWHLATMLLADVVETIDNGRLASDLGREARHATDFVSNLRIDNALAVGALARSSLHGQDPIMLRYFHDSLNEVAFLVEPWTVVLVHSFAKAGYLLLENLRTPQPGEHMDVLAERFRQNCEFCICALQYLARKSDMAFLVARNLSKALDLKLSRVL
ncbi:hypothetical protein BJX76DRAFT_338758 [Aspergillus varians]